MFAAGLQIVQIGDDEVVLKRGIHAIKVGGHQATAFLLRLPELIDGGHSREDILKQVTPEQRDYVAQLLATLVARGLVSEERPAHWPEQSTSAQAVFFSNFFEHGRGARAKLAKASILVAGTGPALEFITNALLECGIGCVLVAEARTSHGQVFPRAEEREGHFDTDAGQSFGRPVKLLGHPPRDVDAESVDLICVTESYGESETLQDMNRLAMRLGKPFLPVWLSDMIGYVGPLVVPGESACLRCYGLRRDSNDRKVAVSRAMRAQLSCTEPLHSAGFLPPMLRALTDVAAMEIAKFVGQFAPSDAIGHSLEINLVAFNAAHRRVLKVPRCPDCSETMRRPTGALMLGPQINNYD